MLPLRSSNKRFKSSRESELQHAVDNPQILTSDGLELLQPEPHNVDCQCSRNKAQPMTTSRKEGGDPEYTMAPMARDLAVPTTGWPAMVKTVREYDEEKVQDCKEDMDTLLVFAGLYSAVLSAFIIESYQLLQPNSGGQTVQLLQQLVAQNYSFNGGFLNSTSSFPSPVFTPPTWAIRVNILWFASLIFSLATASFGMLVKQWLREYLAMEYPSPQKRLRARQYRQPGIKDWRVYEIAATLPLLLQLALGLFFIGLCYFTSAIDSSVANTTYPLVGGWGFFFFFTTIGPLFSPRCPFKTTLLKALMKSARRYRRRFVQAIIRLIQAVWNRIYSQHNTGASEARSVGDDGTADKTLVDSYQGSRVMETAVPLSALEEDQLVEDSKINASEILLSVDAIMPGNALLPTIIHIFKQQGSQDPDKILTFVFALVSHRIGADLPFDLQFRLDLRSLSKVEWMALTQPVSEVIQDHFADVKRSSTPPWLSNALIFLLSTSNHDLPSIIIRCFRTNPDLLRVVLGPMVAGSSREPEKKIQTLLWLIGLTDGEENARGLSSTLNLGKFGIETRNSVMEIVTDALQSRRSRSFTPDSPPWITHAILLLLSEHTNQLPERPREALQNLIIDPTSLSDLLAKLEPTDREIRPSRGHNTIASILRFLGPVLPLPPSSSPSHAITLTSALDLSPLMKEPVRVELMKKVVGAVETLQRPLGHLGHSDIPWMTNAILLLLSEPEQDLHDDARRLLLHWTSHPELLSAMIQAVSANRGEPTSSVHAMHEVLRRCNGNPDLIPPDNRSVSILDLSFLSKRAWNNLVGEVVKLFGTDKPRIYEYSGPIPWQLEAAILLLSRTTHDLPDNAKKILRSLILDQASLSILLDKIHSGQTTPKDILWVIQKLLGASNLAADSLERLGVSTDDDVNAEKDAWYLVMYKAASLLMDLDSEDWDPSPIDLRNADQWAFDLMALLLSRSSFPLPYNASLLFRTWIRNPETFTIVLESLEKYQPNPAHVIWGILTLTDMRVSNFPDVQYLTEVPDLTDISSKREWITLTKVISRTVVNHINFTTERYDPPANSQPQIPSTPEWIVDAVMYLLSYSSFSLPRVGIRALRLCFQCIPTISYDIGFRVSAGNASSIKSFTTMSSRIIPAITTGVTMKNALNFYCRVLCPQDAHWYYHRVQGPRSESCHKSTVDALRSPCSVLSDPQALHQPAVRDFWNFLTFCIRKFNLPNHQWAGVSTQMVVSLVLLSRASPQYNEDGIALLSSIWANPDTMDLSFIFSTLREEDGVHGAMAEEICKEIFLAQAVKGRIVLLSQTFSKLDKLVRENDGQRIMSGVGPIDCVRLCLLHLKIFNCALESAQIDQEEHLGVKELYQNLCSVLCALIQRYHATRGWETAGPRNPWQKGPPSVEMDSRDAEHGALLQDIEMATECLKLIGNNVEDHGEGVTRAAAESAFKFPNELVECINLFVLHEEESRSNIEDEVDEQPSRGDGSTEAFATIMGEGYIAVW